MKIIQALMVMFFGAAAVVSEGGVVKTIVQDSNNNIVFEVPIDSVLRVLGGVAELYGGSLEAEGEGADSAVRIGIVEKGDLIAGFGTYTLPSSGGTGFLTIEVLSGEEASSLGLQVALPGVELIVTPPPGGGLKITCGRSRGRTGSIEPIVIVGDPGGKNASLKVEPGDVISSFESYLLGTADGWHYATFQVLTKDELVAGPGNRILVVESSSDALEWETMAELGVSTVSAAKKFFRARLVELPR